MFLRGDLSRGGMLASGASGRLAGGLVVKLMTTFQPVADLRHEIADIRLGNGIGMPQRGHHRVGEQVVDASGQYSGVNTRQSSSSTSSWPE